MRAVVNIASHVPARNPRECRRARLKLRSRRPQTMQKEPLAGLARLRNAGLSFITGLLEVGFADAKHLILEVS